MRNDENTTKREPVTKVSSLEARLRPFLSDQALVAFRSSAHDAWLPDMVIFARSFAKAPTDDDLRQLGVDLSGMVDLVSRTSAMGLAHDVPKNEHHFNFLVDGLLSVPLEVLLEDGRHLALLHARVCWSDFGFARDNLKWLVTKTFGVHVLDIGEECP